MLLVVYQNNFLMFLKVARSSGCCCDVVERKSSWFSQCSAALVLCSASLIAHQRAVECPVLQGAAGGTGWSGLAVDELCLSTGTSSLFPCVNVVIFNCRHFSWAQQKHLTTGSIGSQLSMSMQSKTRCWGSGSIFESTLTSGTGK